jgi:hypothetical protein
MILTRINILMNEIERRKILWIYFCYYYQLNGIIRFKEKIQLQKVYNKDDNLALTQQQLKQKC